MSKGESNKRIAGVIGRVLKIAEGG